jgi:hypothetical protein
MKIIIAMLIGVAFWPLLSQAQLSVTVSPVESKGNKAVVKLTFKNDMTNAVESARATVRLANGKDFLETETKWVIGGERNAPNLAPGATNTFFFVITSEKPLPKSDLTANVIFNRIVLDGGILGDLVKDVKIEK